MITSYTLYVFCHCLMKKFFQLQSHESNIENKGSAIQIQSTSVFLAALSFACEALISCTKQLNIIDEENGDGNYGSTLAQSANAIKIEMKVV